MTKRIMRRTKPGADHLGIAMREGLRVSDALGQHVCKLHALRLMANSADLDEDDASAFDTIVGELLAEVQATREAHDIGLDHVRVLKTAKEAAERAAEEEANRRSPEEVAEFRKAISAFTDKPVLMNAAETTPH